MKCLIALSLLSLSIASWAGPKITLDWTFSHKGTQGYDSYGRKDRSDEYAFDNKMDDKSDKGNIRFLSAQILRDKLVFEVIAHNPGTDPKKDSYQCFYLGTSDSQTHMDDDVANEYKGAKLIIQAGQDNKLALNQRKKFKIEIPAPKREASLANIHLGLWFSNHSSKKGCYEAVNNYSQNFHQYDWDITPLRAPANAQL